MRFHPFRVAAAIVLSAGIAVVALLVFVDMYPDRAVSWAVPIVSKATGRELKIGGPTELRLFAWKPRLVLKDITFANPDWSKEPQMVEAKRIEVAVALRPLFRRWQTVIARLQIDDGVVRLEQRKDGSDNWTLTAAEAAKPDDRSEVPAVRRLELRNARILYRREGAAESDTDLQIATARGTIGREMRIKGQGRYQKNAAEIVIRAGSIAELQDADFAYPIDVDLHAGPTSASMRGHLKGALDSGGLDVTMRVKGHSLSELYPLIGVVLPKSPPYQLTGKLGREGSVWKFSGFEGRMGDSDLSGNLQVDVAPTPPFMKADFRSKLLDFDDLAGLVGAPPATGAGETASAEQKAEVAQTTAEGRVLPDVPVDVPRLQAMDIDATLVATKVDAPNHLPIDGLNLHLTLKDGTLRAEPAMFQVGGGRVELRSALYTDKRPLRLDVDLKARDVEAARILGNTPFTQDTSGKLGAGMDLKMAGNSLREMAATADGRAQLALSDARVSHLLIELMGLDVMESLGVALEGDAPIDVRCAAFDFTAENGKVKSDLAVIDTDDTNITADMSLNLDNEMLSLRIVPHPKDVSFLALRQDLMVEGRLADLDVYPDPLKLGPVKGAMQKINFVLAPVIGLLTPFDLNLRNRKGDNGCVAFLARQPAPAEKPDKSGKAKGEVAKKAPVRDPKLLPPVKLPPAVAKTSKSKTAKAPSPAHKTPPASREAKESKPRRPTIFHH